MVRHLLANCWLFYGDATLDDGDMLDMQLMDLGVLAGDSTMPRHGDSDLS